MDPAHIVISGLLFALTLLIAMLVGHRAYQAPARQYRRRLRREDRLYATLMAPTTGQVSAGLCDDPAKPARAFASRR